MLRRLKSMLRTSSAICASAALLLSFALPASAASTYASFASDIRVNRDASFVVTETITGAFPIERHGIYRSIPVSYVTDVGTTQRIVIDVLSVTRDGEPETFSDTVQGAYEVVKIGDADVTFSGPFVYEITYRVERAMLYHDAYDELYWNVTGTDWDEPLRAVGATISVDGNVGPEGAGELSATCYTGAFGSTAQECVATVQGATVAVDAGDFLTVSVSIPKGVIYEPNAIERAWWWLGDNWMFLLIAALPIVSLVGLTAYWYRHGRDAKPQTIVPEYEPPEHLSPAEVAVLANASFSNRDFSATIVDLAVRGYLQIVDEEKSTLGFKSHAFTLRKKKPADGDVKPHERAVFEKLFERGDEYALGSANRAPMVQARRAAEDHVNLALAAGGYFSRSPKQVRDIFLGVGTVLAFLIVFSQGIVQSGAGVFLLICGLLTAGLFYLFARIMPKRGPRGDVAYAKALGFKLYLETAERYRIEWQEKEGIFEKYLPYAMVFGVADKWASALADVAREQPDWYVGNFAVWNAMNFTDRIDSTFAAAAATAMAPKSSGGSGGGGFSGGGFGGGGGGSW